MAEAGYRKGADGFYTGVEGRPVFEYKVITSAQNDSERSILADGWRRAGFAFEEGNFSPAETSQGELASTFRSFWTTSGGQGEGNLAGLTSAVIPIPQNGWRGGNRGGWSNPEYDRIVDLFNTTLGRSERDKLVVQAAKLNSEELPVLPLFFNPAAWAWPTALKGVHLVAPTTEPTWNIHTWELG